MNLLVTPSDYSLVYNCNLMNNEVYIIAPDIDNLILGHMTPDQILHMSQVNIHFWCVTKPVRAILNRIKLDLTLALKENSVWIIKWVIKRRKLLLKAKGKIRTSLEIIMFSENGDGLETVVKHCNFDIFKWIFDKMKAWVISREYFSPPALFITACKRKEGDQMLKYLVDKWKKVFVPSDREELMYYKPTFDTACQFNNIECAKFMLDCFRTAMAPIANRIQSTIIKLITPHFSIAVDKGYVKLTKLLFKEGVKCNANLFDNKDPFEVLFQQSYANKYFDMAKYLYKMARKLNRPCNLAMANFVKIKDTDSIQWLLDFCLNNKVPTMSYKAFFYLAVSQQNVSLAKNIMEMYSTRKQKYIHTSLVDIYCLYNTNDYNKQLYVGQQLDMCELIGANIDIQLLAVKAAENEDFDIVAELEDRMY